MVMHENTLLIMMTQSAVADKASWLNGASTSFGSNKVSMGCMVDMVGTGDASM